MEISRGSSSPSARSAGSDPDIITPPTRFDVVSAGEVRAALHRLVENSRTNIVVDLTEVEFIDSAGLAALVSGMKRARKSGGDVRLVKPSSDVAMRIFDLTCLTKAFTFVGRPHEAGTVW